MTRRTPRLLLFGLTAAVLAIMLAAWALWPRTAITRENADKIRMGMTLAEVEAILGGPARDESTASLTDDNLDMELVGIPEILFDATCDGEMVPASNRKLWISDSVVVRVCFDAEGRALCNESVPVRRAELSPLDRLRRWLGL
jgi:hypothetical protein